jgi:chromosome segregation ATPase
MKATTVKSKLSTLLIAAAIAGVTTNCNREKEPEQIAKTDQTEYISKSEYNSMVAAKNATEDTLYQAINEIDNNLKTVRENNGLLAGTKTEGMSKKDEILGTITAISSLLDQNKEKIKKLNGQLASLRSQRAKLKTESADMRKSINDKEIELAQLHQELSEQTTTINYLNQLVADLRDANTVANDQSKKMDKELHKAYYALGSYKELKAHNVVEKTGGVLGLGKSEEIKPGVEKQYFTEIDTREVTKIAVHAKKVKLVTHHPVGSYEWEKNEKNTEALTITDPQKFWATSKYLVVEVR